MFILKSSDVTADILNFLSDGKLHTYQEIADEVECSYSTVRRHIESLSYKIVVLYFLLDVAEIYCGLWQ